MKIFSKKFITYNKKNNRAKIKEKTRNICKLIKNKVFFT